MADPEGSVGDFLRGTGQVRTVGRPHTGSVRNTSYSSDRSCRWNVPTTLRRKVSALFTALSTDAEKVPNRRLLARHKLKAGKLLLAVEHHPDIEGLFGEFAGHQHRFELLDLLRPIGSLLLERADLRDHFFPRLAELVRRQRLLHGLVVGLGGLLELPLVQVLDELLRRLLQIGQFLVLLWPG